MSNWKAELYSRHGGSQHGSWWKQDRRSKFCLKTTDGSLSDITDVDTIDVLVYVRLSSVELDNLRKEFLRYIGGQSHLLCSKHNLPLITSHDKEYRCNKPVDGISKRCNRKGSFCCPEFQCSTITCKKCFQTYNVNEINNICYTVQK